jgi:hypothetical protein
MAKEEVLVRLLNGCFFLCSSLLVGAGCAYGSNMDGFELGTQPIDSVDSGEYDSAPPLEDSSPPVEASPDVNPAPDSGGSPETGDPFDTSRPDPDSGGPACTLTLPTGIPACDSCLSASCCSLDDACGSDPNCLSFSNCLGMCESAPLDGGTRSDGGADADASADAALEDCVAACETEYPSGESELAALDTCLEDSCATACEEP